MGFAEVALVFDRVTCLAPAAKLLAVALADRADSDGVCWPSLRELERRTCQSRRSVMRHLAELRDLGLVASESRRKVDPVTGQTRQSTNLYRLDLVGVLAGNYSKPEKSESAQNGRSASGGQIDTLTSPAGAVESENPSSGSGCQNDTLIGSGCQIVQGQGDTGVTPINNQQELSTSPLPPVIDSGGAVPGLGEGDFSPVDDNRLGAGAPAGGGSRFGFAFDAVAQPPVGEDMSPESSVSGLIADRRLCDEVVPPGLGRVPDSAVGEIAGLIWQRLDAGWRRDQIREALGFRRVPDRIHSVTGLVRARFRDDVPAVPPSGPVAGVSAGGFEWRTAAGRRVKRYEVDWSRVLAVHRRALAAGETVTEHRAEFLWELTGGVVDDFLI